LLERAGLNSADHRPGRSSPRDGATPYYAPFKADYKFGKILPNIGFTYRITNPISVFGSWAKGFSAPRTDNLYPLRMST
jgi:iron complex outermembrane receptor protein